MVNANYLQMNKDIPSTGYDPDSLAKKMKNFRFAKNTNTSEGGDWFKKFQNMNIDK